ncbi:hypothetical protein OG453_40355 [Streptomyces sp. NBC_01381]|uniref:hypothetical protein n=1 Tax=Streptomyces sp. NBC_01381 TaxID=2903845 RepID=UPI00224FB8F3|nr:hypothetical protein [Streptomyces sp. NBC_01381]MCX4672824.1 hypothetical protein [Streptomyces sp. NBC_01381]
MLSFFSTAAGWQLYAGVGDRGRPLAVRAGAPAAVHLAQDVSGRLWAAAGPGAAHLVRISLPGLAPEPVPRPGGRIGALAAAPEDGRLLVTVLPQSTRDVVELRLWEGAGWRTMGVDPPPHISTSLAWLSGGLVVYESVYRRLAVLALGGERAAEITEGRLPAVAALRPAWYAVTGRRVLEFDVTFPYRQHPVRGFRFGAVSALSFSPGGAACLWTESRFPYRVKGFGQRRGSRRFRVRSLDRGTGIVLSRDLR